MKNYTQAYVKNSIEAAKRYCEAFGFYIKYQFDHNLLLMPHQWIKEAYEELVSPNINKFGRSNIDFKILRTSDKL